VRLLLWLDVWFAARRARLNEKHRSGWDSPVTGTDLLGAMVASHRRKRRPLP